METRDAPELVERTEKRLFIGPKCTLAIPSWPGNDDELFNPRIAPASPDLGVVADIFWPLPGVLQINHCFAFAAVEHEAAKIISDPLSLSLHIPESPISRAHDLDGQVLLLWVDHEGDTIVHLAELIVGVLYSVPIHCTVLKDGFPVRIEYGEVIIAVFVLQLWISGYGHRVFNLKDV